MIERWPVLQPGLEVRAGVRGRTVHGYATVFGELSQDLGGFREMFAPGAFVNLQDDIRALWQHDHAQVMGRTRAGTLRLREDARGLAVEVDPPETAQAAGWMAAIQRGDVDGMSIGFYTLQEEWRKDNGQAVRVVTQAKLLEVSVVTFPAYPQTEAAVRSVASELYGVDHGVALRRMASAARQRQLALVRASNRG